MTTRSRITRLAACLTLAISAAACGDSDPVGPSESTTAYLTVKNEANVPIVDAKFTLCSESEWGSNRLASGETIAPGATRTWSIEPGCWDIRLSTGVKYGTWFDKHAGAGETIRVALPESASSVLAPLISLK